MNAIQAQAARAPADHGSLTAERTHKLCGDHQEHVYEALRIGTHGAQCTSLQWAAADPEQLVVGHRSSYACYTGARSGHDNTGCASGCISCLPMPETRCWWACTALHHMPERKERQLHLSARYSGARAAAYDVRSVTRSGLRQHGSSRCVAAFNARLSHVAVYGDAMAPAIELQCLWWGKFTHLVGHMVQVRVSGRFVGEHRLGGGGGRA